LTCLSDNSQLLQHCLAGQISADIEGSRHLVPGKGPGGCNCDAP
jgi:hypothetical protein